MEAGVLWRKGFENSETGRKIRRNSDIAAHGGQRGTNNTGQPNATHLPLPQKCNGLLKLT